MHHITFLQDLAIVMIVAGIVTVLFRQFKQPVVLGYILAGVIIGPHTPPFPLIADEDAIKTLSELGVIFLMFSLGLEFSLRKLRAVGATAFIAAILEILLMVFVGYELGRLFGWKQMDCVFLGAILAISSTTIIIKALEEIGKTKEKFAALIFGILVVEDILAIVMIALLSGFAVTGSLALEDIGRTVLRLSAFLGALLVGGLIAVPRLLNYVAKFKSNEMLLVTVVGLCFGVSLLAVKLGYSVALGAFLIGAIIAEARHRGADPSGARSFQRGVFCLHRVAHRPAHPDAIRRADPRHHRGGRRWQGADLLARHLPRWTRSAHFPARRHGTGADRRILIHHRRTRPVVECDQRVSLPHRRGRLRADHALHAISHSGFR
jgi:Kef-type K+ transport system membrane component KefB